MASTNLTHQHITSAGSDLAAGREADGCGCWWACWLVFDYCSVLSSARLVTGSTCTRTATGMKQVDGGLEQTVHAPGRPATVTHNSGPAAVFAPALTCIFMCPGTKSWHKQDQPKEAKLCMMIRMLLHKQHLQLPDTRPASCCRICRAVVAMHHLYRH